MIQRAMRGNWTLLGQGRGTSRWLLPLAVALFGVASCVALRRELRRLVAYETLTSEARLALVRANAAAILARLDSTRT